MKLKRKINQSLIDVLEQMKSLNANDRQSLLIEHIENICFDDEEVLMVPNFGEEESK